MRDDIVIVVIPLASSPPVPIVEPPSLNVTVPVGIPCVDVTVAVNVMDSPKTEDKFDELTLVFVLACWTVCVITLEVLAPKLLSPPYAAVIGCAPAVSVEVMKVAMPLPFNVPAPMELLPSLNVTLPVGVPCVDVTVAVNVTLCP